jgi:hypothetical protein
LGFPPAQLRAWLEVNDLLEACEGALRDMDGAALDGAPDASDCQQCFLRRAVMPCPLPCSPAYGSLQRNAGRGELRPLQASAGAASDRWVLRLARSIACVISWKQRFHGLPAPLPLPLRTCMNPSGGWSRCRRMALGHSPVQRAKQRKVAGGQGWGAPSKGVHHNSVHAEAAPSSPGDASTSLSACGSAAAGTASACGSAASACGSAASACGSAASACGSAAGGSVEEATSGAGGSGWGTAASVPSGTIPPSAGSSDTGLPPCERSTASALTAAAVTAFSGSFSVKSVRTATPVSGSTTTQQWMLSLANFPRSLQGRGKVANRESAPRVAFTALLQAYVFGAVALAVSASEGPTKSRRRALARGRASLRTVEVPLTDRTETPQPRR